MIFGKYWVHFKPSCEQNEESAKSFTRFWEKWYTIIVYVEFPYFISSVEFGTAWIMTTQFSQQMKKVDFEDYGLSQLTAILSKEEIK